MPDHDDALPPPPGYSPGLFREQSIIGVPEHDQVVEDRNEIIRTTLERIQEELNSADDDQRAAFERLRSSVADFNRGAHRELDIEAFSARLAEMIEHICEEEEIEFQHGLMGDGAAPGGP
ncbi:hypothetical protein [Legionella oakridgensis]|uniref:hypothetical protein n=1 Tax=Legionella oakridgensis TaxID=29423 RepID=UPI0003DE5818|nr:hypothetical protein [Legionella oakridgensis]ETO93445.1 hypothetical protein LOR_46c07820 [Legionella oakridgensis RV-2-2007]